MGSGAGSKLFGVNPTESVACMSLPEVTGRKRVEEVNYRALKGLASGLPTE
jgi:hypothetical protein